MTIERKKYAEADLLTIRQHLEAVRDFYANVPRESPLYAPDRDDIEWALEDVNDMLQAEYG